MLHGVGGLICSDIGDGLLDIPDKDEDDLQTRACISSFELMAFWEWLGVGGHDMVL